MLASVQKKLTNLSFGYFLASHRMSIVILIRVWSEWPEMHVRILCCLKSIVL